MEKIDTLSLIFKNKNEYEKAKNHFLNDSNFIPDDFDDKHNTIIFKVQDQEDADSTEYYIEQELIGDTNIDGYYFESSNYEDGLEGYYIKGGNIGKTEFDFLKKYPNIKYQIEKKENGNLLKIQKNNENYHYVVIPSVKGKGIYYINGVSKPIGVNTSIGDTWYGDEPYTLSGVILLLKQKDFINDNIDKITKYPTTYNEFLILMNDFQLFRKYSEFLNNKYFKGKIYDHNKYYINTEMPSNRYYNVKGHLTPCYWNQDENKSSLLYELFNSDDKYLINKVLFGTRIGVSDNGNYGTKQGFINSGEKYLINLSVAKNLLSIDDWHKINDSDIELDSKYESQLKKSSKSNFKIIIDAIVESLNKNKTFQEYLKGVDSESLKGFGLKEGDSVIEAFDKYVKVKTKDNDYVYVVLTTGKRSFEKPTIFAKGGEINAFTMRLVKGTDDNSSEILTKNANINFKQGGRLNQNEIHTNKMFFGGGLKNKKIMNTIPDIDDKQVLTKKGEYVQVVAQTDNLVYVIPLNQLGTGVRPIQMNISELDENSFMAGGKISFKEKSRAIARQFVGKKVEPKYQKEYGKVYDKEEAKEVGNKIAGAQKAKYDKAEKGIKIKRPGSGNPLMKKAIELAKKNRKPSQKWTDAVKIAYSELKNN